MSNRGVPWLDLAYLPAEVRAALEAAIDGDHVVIIRAGRPIGSLEFHASVPDGIITDLPTQSASTTSASDRVTVVATAMVLSDTARHRLSDEFGDGYIVLDFAEAPVNADVLLIQPVSVQLLAGFRRKFPYARIIISEIEDEELGIRYPGPVSRLLDSGASAYLPPKPIAGLAAAVRTYLSQGHLPALESADPPSTELPAGRPRQIDQ